MLIIVCSPLSELLDEEDSILLFPVILLMGIWYGWLNRLRMAGLLKSAFGFSAFVSLSIFYFHNLGENFSDTLDNLKSESFFEFFHTILFFFALFAFGQWIGKKTPPKWTLSGTLDFLYKKIKRK